MAVWAYLLGNLVSCRLMRRKKLISPEKPVPDRIEYRFKMLLLPNLSYALSPTVLGAFVFGIFAIIKIKSINEAILTFLGFSLGLLVVELIAVWFVVKKSDVVMTSENISGVDYWLRRNCIGWQEITLLKQYNLFGTRYLTIKTADGKSVQIAPRYYNAHEILDRVRELAGEDHILVRALEKELSRPRYELTKLWCWVIGTIALTMSIYLIGGNMYAAEQEKPLEQAIATYVRQHPKTAPNQSAIELQALMTKLGLSVEVFGDGSEVKVKPEKAAIAEWKEIEPIFKKYLDNQLKTKESIEPIPEKLVSYIKFHQADINTIETLLMNNPVPHWGSDSAWIEKSDPKGGDSLFSKWMNEFHLWYLENLIIINIFDKQSLPTTDISRDLVAIERIQQSFQSLPSLVGQLMSSISERRISDMVRRVDRIPTGWGENLFSIDRHKQMISAIENHSMWFDRILQNQSTLDRLLINENNSLRFIPGYFHLFRPHIRLGVVNRYREVQQGLAYWSKQNICHTDGLAGVIPTSILGIDNYYYSTPYLTSQYQKVLRSDLRWEATTAIRQVKDKLAAGQKVDIVAKDFNIPSQICPGENWTAKAKNGAVSIEFSHSPNWKALGVNNSVDIDPLTYTIKPIDR
jgi:hypothetical protein